MFSFLTQPPLPFIEHNVRLMFLKDQPLVTLGYCRTLSKGFRSTTDQLIQEKFTNFFKENCPLSEKDYTQIKAMLAKKKDPIKCINQIPHKCLKAVVTQVYATLYYPMWDMREMTDFCEIQKNVVFLNNFLLARVKFYEKIAPFKEDELSNEWLIRQVSNRSISVHDFFKFSSDEWFHTWSKNINELVGNLKKETVNANDTFYRAFYFIYFYKDNNFSDWGIEQLKQNANKNHALSCWVYGEHLVRTASKFNEGLVYLKIAANHEYYFACALAEMLYERDKDEYRELIIRLVQNCCTNNYARGFYLYGILYKDKYFSVADHLNIACNHFIKAVELGYKDAEKELELLEKAKDKRFCVTQ
jgi:hypothetical protein